MTKVIELFNDDGSHYAWHIYCPACKTGHGFDNKWTFNGDMEKPTFTPSMLYRSGHYLSEHKTGDKCWCTYNQEHPDNPVKFGCTICHSFVTDGKIQFLSDCTHEFAGQTVNLEDI